MFKTRAITIQYRVYSIFGRKMIKNNSQRDAGGTEVHEVV